MTSQQWNKILMPLLDKEIELTLVGSAERGVLKRIEEHVLTLHRPVRYYESDPQSTDVTVPQTLEIVVALQAVQAVSYLETDKS